MAVCKWYLLNIRCFLSCVQIFEHFLNTLRPHFCVALCHLAVGAKIALKRGKKNCKPLFRDLHFLCELFRSRIIKFYVIWLKNVVFRLFAHSFRPRPPFNPIFSFSLKTHNKPESHPIGHGAQGHPNDYGCLRWSDWAEKAGIFWKTGCKTGHFLIVEEALWWGAQNDSKIIEWQQIDNKRREIKA